MRRFGVSTRNPNIHRDRRTFTTSAALADRAADRVHASNLKFLQAEDQRLLAKTKKSLAALESQALKIRTFAENAPRNISHDDLPSVPKYTLGVQRARYSDTINAANKMLERTSGLREHLIDLEHQPYEDMGGLENDMEWFRKIRRADRAVQEEELESLEYKVHGQTGQVMDGLAAMRKVVEGYASDQKPEKVELELPKAKSERKEAKETTSKGWFGLNKGDEMREKAPESDSRPPPPPQQQTVETKVAGNEGAKVTESDKVEDDKPVEKKRAVGSNLRDMQARLEKSFQRTR